MCIFPLLPLGAARAFRAVSIFQRIRSALRPKQEPPPSRDELSLAEMLLDLRLEVVAKHRRIRALEGQIKAQGKEPTPTPTGRQLAAVAEVLEALATGRPTIRYNTLQLRQFAALVRGLARFT